MSLEQVRSLLAAGVPDGRADEDSVRRLWWAALATLQEDLLGGEEQPSGVWLACPLPALYEPGLLRGLQGWVWAPPEVAGLLQPRAPLLPEGVDGSAARGSTTASVNAPPPGAGRSEGGPGLEHGAGDGGATGGFRRLPLREGDGTDPLLLLITPRLQVALALDGPERARRLLVRFDAEVLSAVLKLLDRRLREDDPAAAARLRQDLRRLGPLHNDPALALQFWPLLAQRLAGMAPSVTLQPLGSAPRRREPAARGGDGPAKPARGEAGGGAGREEVSGELALLEALTHEIRTPLATIRTLIRSLLRRPELPELVRQRLEQIDGECSEQIDRFGLIFLAAELQRQPAGGQPLAATELARTDLSQLLQRLEALWQRQLARRGLRLRLEIAADLPPVLSDPTRLETMLGGLMDRFSRGLPSGREVRLKLVPAGSRLKLRIDSDDPGPNDGGVEPAGSARGGNGARRVGPVLSWNPATGSLQLSRQAAQRLLHRLGGRLTERGGDSLTVFFPLAERQS